MNSSIKLKLNESNELKFKLHVQGTSSEASAQQPKFRFILQEKDKENTVGYIFSVTKEENGQVAVTIPPLEGTLSEDKTYIGKMEVLLGSRYFVPSELEIQFEKEFKITAEPIIQSKKEQNNYVAEHIVEQKVQNPTVEENKKPKQPYIAIKQTEPFHITADDIKKANGNDSLLKAIISEKVAKQIPKDRKEYLLYVEMTFNKVKRLLENKNINHLDSKTNAKYDVDDLLNMYKNK